MEQKGYLYRKEVFNDGLGFVELLDVMGNDISVVSSARVSHYNEGSKGEEGDQKLIHYLMKNKHTSPFECVTMTFRIKVPLFVRGQWHRHRTWCISGDTILDFERPVDGGHYGMKMSEFYTKWNANQFLKSRLSQMKLRNVDETDMEILSTNVTDVWWNGQKEVYELKLNSGHTIKTTQDHNFLTNFGWTQLKEIKNNFEHLNNIKIATIQRVGTPSDKPYYFPEVDESVESWKNIDVEGVYQISDFGRVRSFKRQGMEQKSKHPILKKITLNNNKRAVVGLSFNGQTKVYQISHLVWEHFVGERNSKLFILHKNDNPYDNTLDNLYEGTAQDNTNDNISNGNRQRNMCVFSGVESINYVGIEDTYDISVGGEYKNFSANNIIIHNSYNEVSRRYTSENIDEFFYPEKWRVQDTKNKQSSVDSDEINSPYWNAKVKEHVEKSLALYEDMLSNNISREQARMILPQNMYTMYYGTVNLRNLFHFLGLRMNPHAQEEIRVYAYAIADMIKDIVPISFDAWWEHEGQQIVG